MKPPALDKINLRWVSLSSGLKPRFPEELGLSVKQSYDDDDLLLNCIYSNLKVLVDVKLYKMVR